VTRIGGARILRVFPGPTAIREAVRHFAEADGSFFVTGNPAIASNLRAAIESRVKASENFATGKITIGMVGELVSILAGAANVDLLPTARREYLTAFAGLAASELEPSSRFYACKHLNGFHAALVDTIQELRRSGIDLASADLSGKLAEFASLAERFGDALDSHRQSTLTHRIETVLASSPARPAELKRIVWLPESEWPPVWLKLLDWMRLAGIEVVVFTERHIDDPSFFPATENLVAALSTASVETAQEGGRPVMHLFAQRPPSNKRPQVAVLRAADRFLETEWATRFALEKRESGSVCIFSPEMRTYGPLLHAAALRLGANLEMTLREALLDSRFALSFLESLEALASGSLIRVAEFARSGYSGIGHDSRNAAVEAIRECARSDNPWSEFEQSALDPENPIPSRFAELAKWRARGLSRSRTLSEWINGLNHLMPVGSWFDRVHEQEPLGMRDLSAAHEMVNTLRVSGLLMDSSQRMDLAQFVQHCRTVWQSGSFYTRTKGDIRVVNRPDGIGESSTVIAVGMYDGAFPPRRTEDPVLLDQDRRKLAKLRGDWRLPTSYEKAEENRRDIYRLLCSAGDYVLCYPVRDGERELIPAPFLGEIPKAGIEPTMMAKSLEDRFPGPDSAVSRIDALGAEDWHGSPSLNSNDLMDLRRDLLRKSVREAKNAVCTSPEILGEFGIPPDPLSLYELSLLQKCPFRYMAVAKLGLRDGGFGSPWSAFAAAIRRARLSAETADELTKNLLAALEEELRRWVGRAPDEDIELVRIAGPRTLGSFADREIAARAHWGLRYKSQGVDLEFSGLRSRLKVDEIMLHFADRVDALYESLKGDAVPMKLGHFPVKATDDVDLDAAIFIALRKTCEEARYAMVDSLDSATRRLIVRNKDGSRSELIGDAANGLQIDRSREREFELATALLGRLRELLQPLKDRAMGTWPGEHCPSCGIASFCRDAPSARHSNEWDESPDEIL
jgi:hypothetical protein